MKSNPDFLVDNLNKILTGRICILGVGNRMKGDDGAGSVLIDRISGRVSADCLDTGVAPENFLEKIVRLHPDTVLIIDAMDFGGSPGEIRVFAPEDIAGGGISTHALSLQMVCDYLKARIPADVFLIGIQPETSKLGGGLSPSVIASIDSLKSKLLAALQHAQYDKYQPEKQRHRDARGKVRQTTKDQSCQ